MDDKVVNNPKTSTDGKFLTENSSAVASQPKGSTNQCEINPLEYTPPTHFDDNYDNDKDAATL